MHTRARECWTALTSSLWFVPGTIVGAAVVLALGCIELSTRISPETLARFPRLFGAGAEGSRGMLSAVASSMITVAGVTFSITISAFAQASAQYTPRVLRTFMSDRANQVVLGTFVGIFTYCLIVLRTIRGGDEGAFVPSVAVLVGFGLALVGVAVLIYFIHHIAQGLQAATIVDRVRRDTERVVDRLFPAQMGREWGEATEGAEAAAPIAWHPIPSQATGYVQAVDADGLLDFSRERGVTVRMKRGAGDFVVERRPLVTIAPSAAGPETPDEAARALASLYSISPYRTVEQDAAFGFQQIVDIALKALAPGVNDTTTALICVDQLGALLVRLADRRVESRLREERGGRVIAIGPTFAGLVSLALDDVRRNAEDNVTVLGRLLDRVGTAGEVTRDPERRRLLARQAELVAEAAERGVVGADDRAALGRRAWALAAGLAAPAPG